MTDPTAQMSVGETAERPARLMVPCGAVEIGLGTNDQVLPSQCSISAPLRLSPSWPTAHAFAGPSDTTPYRWDADALPPVAGVGTTVHAVPSQCTASGRVTRVPAAWEKPTAHASSAELALTASNP